MNLLSHLRSCKCRVLRAGFFGWCFFFFFFGKRILIDVCLDVWKCATNVFSLSWRYLIIKILSLNSCIFVRVAWHSKFWGKDLLGIYMLSFEYTAFFMITTIQLDLWVLGKYTFASRAGNCELRSLVLGFAWKFIQVINVLIFQFSVSRTWINVL